MSVQAMSWVLESSEAQLGARLVLLAIANHADPDGRNSWCSVRRLSQEARLSERQTRRGLRELEKAGEIQEVGKTRRGTHVYEVIGVTAQVNGGGQYDPRTNRTEGGVRITPEPSEEPSEPNTPGESASDVQNIGKSRKPNLAFDALAELHGGTDHLSGQMAKTVGVALAGIKRATPNVGPDEINRRVQGYRRLPWNRDRAMPSAQSLAKWWADCDRPEESSRPAPSPGLDESWLDQAGDG